MIDLDTDFDMDGDQIAAWLKENGIDATHTWDDPLRRVKTASGGGVLRIMVSSKDGMCCIEIGAACGYALVGRW